MTKAPLRQATLCFLVKKDEVLLAMKKRGFGIGKWNGVGGKLNPGETIEQAMIREAQEEISVTLLSLNPVASISFLFPEDKRSWNQEVHVFLSDQWQGDPQESEEMQPQWFRKDSLPFDQMWQDDSFWLPKVLNGKKLKAEFIFDSEETFKDYSIDEIP